MLYRSTYNANTLVNKNRISSLIQNEDYSTYITKDLLCIKNNNIYQKDLNFING